MDTGAANRLKNTFFSTEELMNMGAEFTPEQLESLGVGKEGGGGPKVDLMPGPKRPTEQLLTQEQMDAYKAEVERHMAEKDTPKGWLKQFGSAVINSPKRMAGMVLGTMNSPLAFVWGSQAARYIDPEQFDKMPQWKQALVATGAGMESAWTSMSKEGEWGTLWGEYYKAVRGKTLEEDLPPNLKWTAPTIEFLANLTSDPLVGTGVINQLMKAKIPKGWIGKMPKKVVETLKELEFADDVTKADYRDQLVDILSKRSEYLEWFEHRRYKGLDYRNQEDYPKWWRENMPEHALSERGGPLLKPEEKFPTMTAPWNAKVGVPKESGAAQVVARQMPETERIAREAKVLQKIPKPKVPTKDQVKATTAKLKVDQFRKDKGLPEAQWPDEVSIERYKRQESLKRINEFRKSKGLPPMPAATTRSVAGFMTGISEDEDGNITFDLKRAAVGMVVGGYGPKWYGRSRRKFLKTMQDNPNWAKVASQIDEPSGVFVFSGLLSRIGSGFTKKITDRFIKLKAVSQPTYLAARTFQSFKENAYFKLVDLKRSLRGVRGSDALFSHYITAHRNVNRARRGIPNPKGVTLQEAQDAIKEIERHWVGSGKSLISLKGAMQSFQKWTVDNILTPAKESGIISEDSYNQILKDNEWYATFEVVDNLPADLMGKNLPIGGEFFSLARQNVIRGMEGTEKAITNPFDATITKFTQAQGAYARNRVASTLVDDPGVISSGLIRPVARNAKEYKIMENMGKKPVMEGMWSDQEFGTINRFNNGRVERYIAPVEIADAMKQLTPWQAPKWIKAFNSLFRHSATTAYLPFTISNAFRDALMAYNYAPVFKTRHMGQFAKSWSKGFWEGLKHEFGGAKSDIAREYVEQGGGFGYVGELRSRGASRKMLLGGKKQTVKEIMNPFVFIQRVSSAVELAPRLAIFEQCKKVGLPLNDGALMARASTIDFNRAGTWAKVANQFVPFLNARFQALVSTGTAFKTDPVNTAAKVFSSVVLPATGLYAWNRLYYSELYDDIPDYMRENYFNFIIGTKVDKRGKLVPEYVSLPKGTVGQMAWNPIEYAMDKMLEKDAKSAYGFFIEYLSDIAPVDFAQRGEFSGTRAAGSITPPVVRGFLEDMMGKNTYTGRDIVPSYMEHKPPHLQYREFTPDTYKWLGNKVDISPERIRNFMSNIFAGYGREGLDPEAMLRGLTGRLVKTVGGEKESKTWEVIEDIELGYNHTRALAEEMIKNGNRHSAIKLMNQWDRGLRGQLVKLRKYGFRDKGGLGRTCRFTASKRRSVMSVTRRDMRSPLERKLSRRR